MSKQKELWISGKDAAAIMSRNSGHEVSTDYVRLLSNQSKIRARAKDGRTKEYFREDVENYKVTGKGPNKQQKEKSVA